MMNVNKLSDQVRLPRTKILKIEPNVYKYRFKMSAIVIGGGISGLSACFYLQRLTKSGVQLFEAGSRVGGWIQSVKNENGTILELGPRTMRIVGISGANTLQLVEELKLDNLVRPVLKTEPAAKNRMLCVDNQLYSLPNSFKSLFKVTPPFTKPIATAILHDLKNAPVLLDDDSIYNFVCRRLGTELADYAVSSLVCGICAGDAKKISVNLLMKPLFEAEQKHGSLVKGFFASWFAKRDVLIYPQSNLAKIAKNWSVWSLQNGLETLPKAIFDDLIKRPEVKIETNAKCDKIEFNNDTVDIFVNGCRENAQHVYCSLPSHKLAEILPKKHEKLIEELEAIAFVTVGVVNLEFDGNVLPVDGFGFLVPPNQNLPILGVIFDTCCFPQENKTVLTVMMGGEWFKSKFGANPDKKELGKIAESEVMRILSITARPSYTKVSILEKCIPQYYVGHNARVKRIRDYISTYKLPITLIGSSYDGIGVNDVIYETRKAVEKNLSEFQ